MGTNVTSLSMALRFASLCEGELRRAPDSDWILDSKGRLVATAFALGQNPVRALELYVQSVAIFEGKLKVAL